MLFGSPTAIEGLLAFAPDPPEQVFLYCDFAVHLEYDHERTRGPLSAPFRWGEASGGSLCM